MQESRATKRRRKNKEKKSQTSDAGAAPQGAGAAQGDGVMDTKEEREQEEAEEEEDEEPYVPYTFKIRRDMNISGLLNLKEVSEIKSRCRAASLLSYLLPVDMDRDAFYSTHWEKTPLLVNNVPSTRFDDLFPRSSYKHIVTTQGLVPGEDMNGWRENIAYASTDERAIELAEDGAPLPPPACQKLATEAGWTVELSCPAVHDDMLWRLLSSLEHEFSSVVQCKAFDFPKHAAGLGRRMDNFDTFFICTEGSVMLTLHQHPEGEQLPRTAWDGKGMQRCCRGMAWYGMMVGPSPSSALLTPSLLSRILFATTTDPLSDYSDAGLDKPHRHVELKRGESVYVPKGWIYSFAGLDERGLLVQISTNIFNAVADIMQLILPQALEAAIQNNVRARKALPTGYSYFMGIAGSESTNDPERKRLLDTIQNQFAAVVKEAKQMVDPAADQHVKNFMTQRLPVPLTDDEEECSIEGRGENAKVTVITKMRMVRPGLAHAVVEDGNVVLYHCMENSRRTYGEPIHPIEFELDDGPAIECLLAAYPHAISVGDLPHPSEEMEDKCDVARALFKEGFLLLDAPEPSRGGGGGGGGNDDDDDDDASAASDDSDDPF